MIITIDGPAVSGKSTAARALAEYLGYYYLYSGSLFRALAYLLNAYAGYDATNIAAVSQKDINHFLDPEKFRYVYTPQKGERILFEDIDITDKLKTPLIDELASVIATNARVRDALKILQHRIADGRNIIVDGRDSGSIVFPKADCKFYITASTDERARRMQGALKKRGVTTSLAEVQKQIIDRDVRDMQRELAPLIKPEDAIEVDTTGLQKEETLQKILRYVQPIGEMN